MNHDAGSTKFSVPWATSSGIAVATERHPPAGVRLLGLLGDAGGHARADRARADAVDGDAGAAELDGEALGEADDAGLLAV